MPAAIQEIVNKRAALLTGCLVVLIAVLTSHNMPLFAQKIEIAIDKEFFWGTDYLIGLGWWVFFAVMIFVFAGESARLLQTAWFGKLLVTLGAMLIYERFYFLDSYSYFLMTHTGEHWMYPGFDFRNDLMPSPFESPNLRELKFGGGVGLENTIRFILLISLVSGPFFHALKVWIAFAGLMAVWCFYRAAVVALGRPYPRLFLLLAFFPSLIFWGSTLGKDPLQCLCLGLYAYGSVLWIVEGRPLALLPLGLGLFGSYLLRPWAALMAIIALCLGILMGRCRGAIKISVLGPMVLVAISAVPFLGVMGTNINLEEFQLSMAWEILEAKGQSFAQDTKEFGASGVSLIDEKGQMRKLPIYEVMFGGLFRPLPFDITNFATGLAALENVVLLVMAVIGLFHMRIKYLRNPIFLWLLLITLMWSIMYGYIVLANFGSGVRYKIQVLPFFILLILSLTHAKGRAWLETWESEKVGQATAHSRDGTSIRPA